MVSKEITKEEIINEIIKTRNKIEKLEKEITKKFYNKKNLQTLSEKDLNMLWDDEMIDLCCLKNPN